MKKTNVQKLIAILIIGLLMMGGMESCNKDKNDDTPQGGKDPKETTEKFISSNKTIQGLYKSDKVHIFDAVVMVAEDDVTDMLIDTTNKHFSLTFKNDVPEIIPGSVMYIDIKGKPTIVLVLIAETKGKTIDFYGPLGDLSNVFFDTELVFTTDNKLADSLGGNAFSPKKYYETYDTTYNNTLNKSKSFVIDHFDTDTQPGDPLEFSFDFDKDGGIDGVSGQLKVTLQSTVIYTIAKGFGVREVSIEEIPYGPGYNNTNLTPFFDSYVYSVQTINVRQVSLSGSVYAKKEKKDCKRLTTKGKYSWRPKIAILCALEIGLEVFWEYNISGELNIPLSLTKDFGSDVTVYYDEDGNKIKEEDNTEPGEQFNILDQTKLSIDANINGSVSIGLPIVAYLSFGDDKLLGIGACIEPYATFEAKGNAGLDSKELDHIGYSLKASAGIDFQLGLFRNQFIGEHPDFMLFKWEEGSKDKNNKYENKVTNSLFPKTLLKYDLVHTPYSLNTSQIKVNDKIYQPNKINYDMVQANIIEVPFQKGSKLKVTYDVISKLFNKDISLLGANIYFKTKEGRLGKSKSFIHFEQEWTPKSDDDYLEALMYDGENNLVGYSKIKNANASSKSSITCYIYKKEVNKYATFPAIIGEKIELTIQSEKGVNMYLEIDGDKKIIDKSEPIDLSYLPEGNHMIAIYHIDDITKNNPFEFNLFIPEGYSNNQNNPPSEEEKITLLISVSDRTEKIPTGKTLTYDYGQNVTFTAAVSPSNHVITIYDGKTKTDLKNGFNINTLSVGTHTINVYVDYDPTTNKGVTSSVVNIEIKEKQEEQPTPQITSVTITGYSNPISNGDTKDFDYGDEVQIAVETDIYCDEISVDFPGYNTDSNNGEKSYKHTFDATESGKVTITATKNGKSSTFYFNIEVEEKTQTVAPKITSVKINERQITNGDKIKDFNWGDNVPIEVTTDIVCDEITIDYPNIFNDVKRGENRSTYSTSFNAEKYGTVTIVAKKNGKTDKLEFKIMVYETEGASDLPNNGEQKEAHNYWHCNDLVFQAAEKASFTGSYWISYNGEDEYNRLVVHKGPGDKFTSKQISLIVSTSITDLSSSNIIVEEEFEGGEQDYYIDITPTDKQLYLIVYVGGGDCGSVEIDGYYCGPFNYHYAPK